MSEFATGFAAERPKKGQGLRVARSGQSTSIVGDRELQTIQSSLNRKQFTPEELTANKVAALLTSYDIPKEVQNQWIIDIQHVDNVSHMNPDLLAAAIYFIYLVGKTSIDSSDFSQSNINKSLSRIPIESKNKEEVLRKYQQSIVRYVVAILIAFNSKHE